jgi:biopolymer transport protein ExbB/TolQ
MSITDRINHGLDLVGAEWVMWLLIAMSIMTVACIIERWRFLVVRRVDMENTWKFLLQKIDSQDKDAIASRLAGANAMEEVVALSVLQERGQSIEALEDIAQAAVETEKLKYNKRLGFLATTASNAPFIGLLGTVVGIVEAFGQLADAAPGQSRSTLIMGSISEALAATAIGLLVAIPAAAAYNWLQGKVDECEARSHILTRRVVARLR